ncbi:protein EVI2B-like [Trachinotus anak]|uniref:protein EVI2B-like n=1 Tax=Trachinotus anak TaxID=443729 RepID=UPI0039F1A6C8
MTIIFISLTFIWLLPLTANSMVTSGQNQDFTDVRMRREVTGSEFTQGHLTAQEAEVSGHYITPSLTANIEPSEERTTNPSSEPSLRTTPTTSSMTFSPVNQRAATPTNSTLSQLNSSTVGADLQPKVTTSTATVVTSQATNPTTTTRVPPILSTSTQSPDTGKTSTPQWTSEKITHPSTQLVSTGTSSTKPADKSTSTSPVTGGDARPSTGSTKPPLVTTKTTSNHKTRRDQQKENANKEGNHSKVAAGIIGGALTLMMVGFLVIFIKKRKLLKKQITTTDWAGPSPFLDGGADNGQVTLRSSNRISFSSFLPQRLSKRLSLLPETDEELEDMTPATTFGDKNQGNTFGQQADGNNVQESNGTAAAVPEMKSTGDVPQTVENSGSVTSSQTNHLLSTDNNQEAANLSPESADPHTVSGAVENTE